MTKEIVIYIHNGDEFTVNVYVWGKDFEILRSTRYSNLFPSTIKTLGRLLTLAGIGDGYELGGAGFSVDGKLAKFCLRSV